ncbi:MULTISPECIES: (4Fe-4S)-binding protein [unclassified Thioalkalivibrio]|nr:MULTISPECIES: (4Fe-4S)-binding protein [unclassified Thioalkalivibrio]
MKVIWDSNKCIHSGNCVNSLPTAFFIQDDKLIVKPENASWEEVLKVVSACPAKAFTVKE